MKSHTVDRQSVSLHPAKIDRMDQERTLLWKVNNVKPTKTPEVRIKACNTILLSM